MGVIFKPGESKGKEAKKISEEPGISKGGAEKPMGGREGKDPGD